MTQTTLNTITANNNNAGEPILFAGTDYGVLVSSDHGTTWDDANSGLIDYNVTSFALSDSNLFAGTGDGVFLSTNNGSNWRQVSKGLPKDFYDTTHYVSINNLCVYHDKTGKTYLFATHLGHDYTSIYLSTNDGANWTTIYLNWGAVNALAVSSEYLYAGTNGWGVWRIPLSDIITEVEDEPNTVAKSFELKQNYPNPFNPTTTIAFEIPKSSFVNLKVYDVLGRKVATLVNEEKPAGGYDVNFNEANLSSGIYFYKIQAGSFVQTKKMILLK